MAKPSSSVVARRRSATGRSALILPAAAPPLPEGAEPAEPDLADRAGLERQARAHGVRPDPGWSDGALRAIVFERLELQTRAAQAAEQCRRFEAVLDRVAREHGLPWKGAAG